MGCCCSKKEGEEKEKENEKASKKPRWVPPPPPPPPEEETVKEVLSETPKAKPKPKPPPPPSPPVLRPDDNEPSKAELEKKPKQKPKPKPSEIPPSDDRSEQPQPSDDACSLHSEVTSNATSATTREREREEIGTAPTSSLPRIQRGNANGNNRRSYSGELLGGGSRRERSSPAVVAGVGCRSGRTSPAPPSRNHRSINGTGNGIKRDMGERSGRRSVSPGAKRREVAGPGGPGEKIGGNRGVPVRRVPPTLTPQPNKGAHMSEGGGGPGTEGKESLENPSVSLECFIFL